MGVSPYDKFTRCETCGCEGLECPGMYFYLFNSLVNNMNYLYNPSFGLSTNNDNEV